MKTHSYETRVVWTGNSGSGTSSYRAYSRNHEISAPNKPVLAGSSDPVFRGDPNRYNPEELLVASASACHMLSYLHVCAVNHVNVISYTDTAQGIMQENEDGGGHFTEILLRPAVRISKDSDPALAARLHADAHRNCFIASSVRFPIKAEPQITVE
ncbi:MAG TPA: OsmC family protein [Bryobacteraceae bacterium]|nr:OsmC family protein [Bryobacteraceae bacterium]